MASVVQQVLFDILAKDRASREFRKIATAADKAGAETSKFGKLAKAGAAGAAVGLGAFAVTSVKAAGDFDKTMRQIASVTSEPAAGLKGLSDLALKMGADTKFSAGEAGDAMLELAKGGLTTAQIRAGALDATLTLAAAGGVGLGEAATFTSNALNTFGLRAEDAGSVAAALAGGANASSASVESLGQALSQVGPGARNAGLSLQETVAALSAFDNAGIKGSDAGTSLKTMLQRLVPTTAAAKTAMSQLNIDFTNADGSFKSLADVSQILKDRLGGLSAEQQSTALSTIFGSDATRAASVLMREGAAGIEKYTKATSDQTAATRIAKASMEGQSGAIEQMKGSLETLAIQAGMTLGPLITKLALMATTILNGVVPAVRKMTDFARNNQTTLKVLGVVIVGLIAITRTYAAVLAVQAAGGLLKFIASTRIATALTRTFTAVQAALNLVMRMNPIGLVISALALLGAGVVLAYRKSDTFRGIVDGLWRSIRSAASWIGTFIRKMLAFKLPGWVGTLVDAVGSIGRGLNSGVSGLQAQAFDGPGIGGSPGDQPRGVRAMMASLPAGTRLISGFRPGAITATGNRSYHAQGRAVDIPPSPALFEFIRSRFGAVSKELIFSPAGGRQIHNGSEHMYKGITRQNHWDHIHWAMARGGVINEEVRGVGLSTGRTYAIGENGPETLIPGAHRGGMGGTTVVVNVNAGTIVSNPQELVRVINDALTRARRSGVQLGFV